MQKNYQMTEVATEETLTIRGAFSGVKLMEPEISATDFLPIKLVFNVPTCNNPSEFKVCRVFVMCVMEACADHSIEPPGT